MMSQDDSVPILEKSSRRSIVDMASRRSVFLPERVASMLSLPEDMAAPRSSRRSSYSISFGDNTSEGGSNPVEPKLEEVKGWLWKLPVSKTFVPLDKVRKLLVLNMPTSFDYNSLQLNADTHRR